MLKTAAKNLRLGPVDANSAINPDHPLNYKRVLFAPVPDGVVNYGKRWLNLCGQNGQLHGTINGQTPTNVMWHVAGSPVGVPFSFVSASSQNVDFGSNSTFDIGLSLGLTVSVWTKSTAASYSPAGLVGIIGKTFAGAGTGRWTINYDGTTTAGQIFCIVDPDNTGIHVVQIGLAGLNDGKWHKVTLVIDRVAATVTLYADSGLAAAQSVSSAITVDTTSNITVANNVRLGSYDNASNVAANFLDGSIANPSVSKRAWSLAEDAWDTALALQGYPDVLRRFSTRSWIVVGGSPYTMSVTPGNYAVSGVVSGLAKGSKVVPTAGSYAVSGVADTMTHGHPMTAAVGSYGLSGVAPTLRFGHQLPTSVGSYSQTGTVTGLKHGYSISVTAGVYSLSGVAAGLTAAHKLSLTAGSYAVSGTVTGLRRGYPLAATPGSYTVSGVASVLRHGYTVPTSAGVYAVSGVTATLSLSHKITAAVGSYLVSGVAPTLRFGHKLPTSVGSYLVSGVAAGLRRSYPISITAGVYSLSGVAASLKATHTMSLTPGSYSQTGTVTGLKHGYSVTAVSGVYALTGTALTLRFGHSISPTTGSYAVSGVNPVLRYGHVTHPVPGAYLVSGVDAGLNYSGQGNKTISPTPGSYALSGVAPTLRIGYQLPTVVGVYSQTGVSPTLGVGHKLPTSVGSYSVTGSVTGLRHGYSVTVVSGGYGLTGTAAAFKRGYAVVPTVGHYAVAGTSAVLRFGHKMPTAAGSYSVTGQSVTFPVTRGLVAAVGVYSLVGGAVRLTNTHVLPIAAGGYGLSGQTVAMKVDHLMSTTPGDYGLVGQPSTGTHDYKIGVVVGLYSLTGPDTVLTYTPLYFPIPGEPEQAWVRPYWQCIRVFSGRLFHDPERAGFSAGSSLQQKDAPILRIWTGRRPNKPYRTWRYLGMGSLAKETLYKFTTEQKTFAADFSDEGAIKNGETIVSGTIDVTPTSGTPTPPTTGTVEVISSKFVDADGKVILPGKGLKCRISGGDPATYTVRFQATLSGGDKIDVPGKLVIEDPTT